MKLFWAFARQNFHATAVYRLDFWLRVASTPILMYGMRWLWITLYTQRPGAFGVSLQQMVTYAVLSMAIENLFYTGPQFYMSRQVRSGAIDGDLLRPLDFHFHMLARSTGEMFFRVIVIALPAMLLGYFLFDLQLPETLQTTFLFVVTLLLGYLVNFHLDFLLGSLGLVTLEVHTIAWVFGAMARFFSGQLVPLWLFPGVLGLLANILPFRAVVSTPLSVYAGVLKGSAILQALAFQLVWLTLLLIVSRWLWGHVQARLVSQGG
ncbi:MAG TPA: ABC-2 family transporter protein [Anaerolineales bacterium]|nr:ABC-2 family transporter protein [Anaerolineales bacterium]